VSDDETLLLLLVSHLATDAWGLGLMLAELNHRLTALPGREDAPLPAPPLTAADVAVAWDDRFADVIRRGPGQFPPFPDLHLPLDRPRPPRPAARGARLIFPVSADLRARVEVAAREAGASFSIACLVAFQLAMHAATGADRVLFGVVRGNRPTGQVQQVVAHLVYAELFLGERPPGATGADLLGRAARFLGDAPLGEQPRAWMQLPPAVRVLFNFHNAALAPTAGPFVTAPDLSRFPYLWETQDVLWQVFSLGEGAVVSALYRDEVYEARTVEGLGEAFLGALEGLARDPG
jgi:hypothetical protein